jgi:hypothetical protein
MREYQRAYYKAHTERKKRQQKERRALKREEITEKARRVYHAIPIEERRIVNREKNRKAQSKRTIWVRERRRNDIAFRIELNLRRRIHYVVRGKDKSESTRKLLGCSIPDFKIYIESKFEPGMSWENYGREGWHIDHIMPCAIFDLSKPEHRKRCFHFSNLQPLWAEENRSKHDKVVSDQFNLL